MTTQQTNLQVAETILAQLGGRRFIAMTGSKNFTGREDGLSFKVGSGPKGITHVRITVTPADLYDVEFLKVRGTTVRTAASIDGIYCDQLEEVFERHTGLYTKF